MQVEERKESELEQLRQNLQIPITELVGIWADRNSEPSVVVGKREAVQVTLEPPGIFPQGFVWALNGLFGLVNTDEHDVRELYKHGELRVFGWIYSFGDKGLGRKVDPNQTRDPAGQDFFLQMHDTVISLLGPNIQNMGDKDNTMQRYYVGATTKTPQQFHGWLIKNWKKYTASAYNIRSNNCLHFVKEALDFLGVRAPKSLLRILDWIRETGGDALERLYLKSLEAQEKARGSGGWSVGISSMLSSGSGSEGRSSVPSMVSSAAGTVFSTIAEYFSRSPRGVPERITYCNGQK